MSRKSPSPEQMLKARANLFAAGVDIDRLDERVRRIDAAVEAEDFPLWQMEMDSLKDSDIIPDKLKGAFFFALFLSRTQPEPSEILQVGLMLGAPLPAILEAMKGAMGQGDTIRIMEVTDEGIREIGADDLREDDNSGEATKD